MVILNRITTKGGDCGETSLGNGVRIAKSSLRIAAIGAVDEANASLGVVRLYTADTPLDAMLQNIQNDLFDLGADLCVPPASRRSEGALRISEAQIVRLEQEIDALNGELQPLTSFVLPGGTPAAAHLHMARTLVRRAERLMVRLQEEENLGPEALRYINRLSDHLFVAARHCNAKGAGDILWSPGRNR